MTAWELNICASSSEKSMTKISWMTAALSRSKKLEPLNDLIKIYEPKLEGEVEQDIAETSLFHKLSRMADAAESKSKASKDVS